MQFSDKLYFILSELREHKRDRAEVLSSCIQERLDTALKSYDSSLADSVSYLSSTNDINLLKKLSRGN